MNNDKHALWVEKYRPRTLNDYIFHDENQKTTFTKMIEDGTIPHLLLSGVQGTGKAQPLYSKILTPNGWKLLGDIQEGDIVNTPDGKTAKVVQTFPQGEKDIYTITFHDGSSTECCLDHLWECYYIDDYNIRVATKHIVDTRTILEYMSKQDNRSFEKFNVSIPLLTNIKYDTNERLSIDPYVLGVLLGDGSFIGNTPKLTSIDDHIIQECQTKLSKNLEIKKDKNSVKEYTIVDNERINYGGKKGNSTNSLTKELRQFELYGKRSEDKFIPSIYKFSSINERWSLVKGLMDTDGHISKKGTNVSYTTVSYKLAHDMRDVLWSLGCTCTIKTRIPTYTYKGEKKKGKLAYTLHINHNNGTAQFFTLKRKTERGSQTFAENHSRGNIILRRRITNIEYKCKSEAKCIKIDHPDELYITDDYIVTHNTSLALILINSLNLDPSDILTLNSSDENSVDDMREKIKSFVSTFAMGEFKVVHLEEADYLSQPAQAILRRMMEEYENNARFILTCNNLSRLMPAIKSRCQHFHFAKHDIDEVIAYAAQILHDEKIKAKLDVLEKYVRIGYPDVRKVIQFLQQNSNTGTLLPPQNVEGSGGYKEQLLELLEGDNWVKIRELLCPQVLPEEWEEVYTFLYKNLDKSKKFTDTSKWESGIVIINDHLYKHSIVADPEINAAAMFIRLGQV